MEQLVQDRSHSTPGHQTVSPYLLVKSVTEEIAFLVATFGAEKLLLMPGEGGGVKHAEVRIGDSVVMMGERLSSTPGSTHVYVKNVDETYKRAIESGATSLAEPRQLPYGDRGAGVRDPQGNFWWIGTYEVRKQDRLA